MDGDLGTFFVWWDLVAALAVLPLAWLVQNLVHEGAHLVVGWVVEGRRPTVLIPWPHRYDGRFYFARCDSGPATKPGSPKARFLAPLKAAKILAVVALVATGISLEAAWTVPAWGVHVWALIVPFFLCPFVDLHWWMRGFLLQRPGTDGDRYRRLGGRE